MPAHPIRATFVGALNVDTLISVKGPFDANVELVLKRHFEINGERQLSEEEHRAILAELNMYNSLEQLSGSSFIAMHAALALGLDLKLAYMGVEGTTAMALPSFSNWLSKHGVDHCLVFPDLSRVAAACVALTYKGQRSLATYPGANVSAGRLFLENYDYVLERLGKSEHIHITSFFDDVTPDVLLRLASDLRRWFPSSVISLDPGLRWVTSRKEFVLAFLAATDTIFLNGAECAALFGPNNSNILEAAFSSSTRLRRVIVKRVNETQLFLRESGGFKCHTIVHEQITNEEIVDDTGAGDVFAGSLLALELADIGTMEQQVALAVGFAKQKLCRMGQDFSDFAVTLAECRKSLREETSGSAE